MGEATGFLHERVTFSGDLEAARLALCGYFEQEQMPTILDAAALMAIRSPITFWQAVKVIVRAMDNASRGLPVDNAIAEWYSLPWYIRLWEWLRP